MQLGLEALDDYPNIRRHINLGKQLIQEHGISESQIKPIMHRPALYEGRAHPDGTIEVPWPTRCREDLYVLVHEIGHVVLGHANDRPRKPKWLIEYEADKFARKVFRQMGIPLRPSMVENAKAYVRHELTKAAMRGEDMSSVTPTIRKWAGWGT